jgi:hypothetical protein
VGLALLLVSERPAAAQLTAALSAASDVRWRGLSLNGGGLALSGEIAVDHGSGLFAGASVTGGDTRRFGAQFLAASAQLGAVKRISNGLAVEAGAAATVINSNVFLPFSGHSIEAFAGISGKHLSARLFLSPAYIVENLATAYLDVNGSLRATPQLRLVGHLGLFVPLSQRGAAPLPEARYDLLIGAARAIGPAELRLSWVRTGASAAYLEARRQARDALVVGAGVAF